MLDSETSPMPIGSVQAAAMLLSTCLFMAKVLATSAHYRDHSADAERSLAQSFSTTIDG